MKRGFTHMLIALPWVWVVIWGSIAFARGGAKPEHAVGFAVFGELATLVEVVVQILVMNDAFD